MKKNSIKNSLNPYLKQHANQPVEWKVWNEKNLETASAQNKLLIISIGYSTCHWCHVMARETFENKDTADIMNTHFLSIKIDREEHPEVDELYMRAIQMMGQPGGWPLNVVALPDGTPIWGGTYFKTQDWNKALLMLANLYRDEPERLNEYGESLKRSVEKSVFIQNQTSETKKASLEKGIAKMKLQWDLHHGGQKGAPKFPLPGYLSFLWHLNQLSPDEETSFHLKNSIQKITKGGIYDQIGGGLSRYAVDDQWRIPHFEKMLYDNALFLEVIAQQAFSEQDEDLKSILKETIDFIKNELTTRDGLFECALDADSEGEEGKYYVWTEAELKNIIENDYPLMAEYFSIGKIAEWESGKNILQQPLNDTSFAEKHKLKLSDLKDKVRDWKSKLRNKRAERTPLHKDDKTLTSWNGMMISALFEIHKYFPEFETLSTGEKALNQLLSQCLSGDNLYHQPNGKNQLLEDYAFIIRALITHFEITGELSKILTAQNLTEKALQLFFQEDTPFLLSHAGNDQTLFSKTFTTTDSVVPSANAVMANNLFLLNKITGNERFLSLSRDMLAGVSSELESNLAYYYEWGKLYLRLNFPFYEVVVAHPTPEQWIKEIRRSKATNNLIIPLKSESDLDLFKNRFNPDNPQIFVCSGMTCKKPSFNPVEAIEQMH